MKQKASENENRKRRLQTANNTLLGVFPIYKGTHTHTYIENGCKGSKIGQNI